MQEIWRDIPGYENYQISNLGNVRNNRNNIYKILTPWMDRKGYYTVSLSKNGIVKKFRVHQLVGNTFIPNPDKKLYLDHINTIKTDNRVENLRWVTHKENMNNPLTRALNSLNKIDNPKLCKPVLQIDKNTGRIIREFLSAAQAQRELSLNGSHISSCCKGKRKTSGGYIWRYK